MSRTAILSSALALLTGGALWGARARPIYNEHADARQLIRAAVARASRNGTNVVLVFGANWCPDCHALDAQMRKPELARLIARDFIIVNIDVGRFDKNVRLAAKYGVPLRRGIPALAVLNSHGQLLYAMSQGQFANARTLSYPAFLQFFCKWAPKR